MKISPENLRALELSKGLEATPGALEKVGKATSAEAARWAFGQWDLRKRARAKFARADEMLFTREALEQATHERVAAYHASHFPEQETVIDMTTGIGADLIALAARGPVIGFELDEERASFAEHNLSLIDAPIASVRTEDSVCWLRDNPETKYAYADPARRVEGRRTLRLDEFSPDPAEISHLFQGLHRGVMKLTPMLPDEVLASLGSRVEFISFRGECREALVMSGSEVESGIFAVQLESGERVPSSFLPTTVPEADAFLFDADPAAVRAHALGWLCEQFNLSPMGDSNGYLTGSAAVVSPWLRAYRVLYQGKADLKSTRRALRELDAATPELKQRGAGLDLIKERQTYATDGRRAVSLVVWKNGKSLRHAIVERI